MVRKPRTYLVLLAGMTLLAACSSQGPAPSGGADSSAPASEPGEPASGGTLTIGIGGYPQSVNPNLQRSAPGYTLHRAMLDTLTVADSRQGGVLGPGLAVSWELVDDTTWQFKLREGVTWHDGTPFTADDVVATIDLVLNGEPPAQYRNRISDATGAEAVDELTVNITSEAPSATLPAGLSDIYIHQAKQIEEGGNDALNDMPVGTGQFMLAEKEEGVSVTLRRYDGYWGEPALLDEVIFRALPEDATRVAALETGEVDIAYNVPPDDADRLHALDTIDIASVPIGQSMLIQFALTAGQIPEDSPLQDPLVRQALNYAVDKQAIIDNVLLGYTEALPGQLVADDGIGFNPNLEPYPYDPERARELLAEAGYPDGFEFTLHTAEGRYVKQREIPEAIAGQLAEVGVTANLDLREWAALITAAGERTLETYYIGWNYFPVMDGDFVVQHYVCDGIYGLMCNEEYDELFAEQRQETDPEARLELLQRMQEILHEEAPAIFLFQAPDIFGVSSRVHGFEPTPDNVIDLRTISVDPAN